MKVKGEPSVLDKIQNPGLLAIDKFRFQGFVNDVVEHNLRTAHKEQPILAYAGALALMATLCSRKITDAFGTTPNVYIAALAPSGSGKSAPQAINQDILNSVGLGMMHAVGLRSGSGLINSLIEQPAMLFQFDEFGKWLQQATGRKANVHLEDAVTKLMTLFSKAKGDYAPDRIADTNKTKGVLIERPHISLFGVSVPDTFFDSLTSDNAIDGFMGRLLVFDAGDNDPMRQCKKTCPLPESITTVANYWAMLLPPADKVGCASALVVAHTDEAVAYAKDFARKEVEYKNELGDLPARVLWNRTAEYADKLALLSAVSRQHQNPLVELADVELGYGLASYLTRYLIWKLHSRVAENDFHRDCIKVKKILRGTPQQTVSRSDLLKRTRIKARDLTEIVGTLYEAGEVKEIVETTNAKPKTFYKLVK